MKKLFLLLIILFIPIQTFANVTKEAYQFYKKIIFQEKIDYPYAKLWIDPEIYAKANTSLSDLRILDQDDYAVPYELIIKSKKTESLTYPVKLTDLGYNDKKISFLLDLACAGIIHNEVTLKTDSKKFQTYVQIESSNDAKSWIIIRENAFVFDISTDYKISHLTIAYPESTARYLRISIDKKTKDFIKITGAVIKKIEEYPADEEEHSFTTTAKNENGKINFWELDFGSINIPADRIQFFMPDKNFQRLVKVLIPAKEKGKWIEIKQDAIWNFSTKKFTGSNLWIDFNEVRTRHLRIEVHNFDNPPLKTIHFKLYGVKRELFFPTDRKLPYTLYFGNSNALNPQYDLSSFIKYLDTAKTHICLLSKQNLNPYYKPPKDKRPWTERYPVIFWTILVLCCLILGWFIINKGLEITKPEK